MNSLAFKIKVLFVVIFAFACAGLYGYQYFWVRPARACEEAGRWWYGRERACGVPVKISDLTGRHMEDPSPPSAPQTAPSLPPSVASGQAKAPPAAK